MDSRCRIAASLFGILLHPSGTEGNDRLFQMDGVYPFHSHRLFRRFCAVGLRQPTTYYVWGCGFTGSHLDRFGIAVCKNRLIMQMEIDDRKLQTRAKTKDHLTTACT